METKDPIEQLREHARKVSEMAGEFSERGFSPLGFQLEAIANEIEKQYMKLPVDADGVPIKPGDEMQMAFDESAKVVAVDSERWFFDQSCLADDGDEYDYEWAANSRHFKPDTVESLLNKFQDDVLSAQGEYVGEVIEADCYLRELHILIEDYAERIRKAVEQ